MVIEETYFFRDIIPYKKGILNKGTFIGLFGVDGIPHLGIIRKGSYYSVNAFKVKVGTPVDKLLTTLEKKNVKSLFVEVVPKVKKKDLDALFKNYSEGLIKDQTCLIPMKELFQVENDSIKVVSDLLHYLDKKQLLGKTYGLKVRKSSMSLMPYSKNDVDRMIKKLKKKR